MKTLHGSFGMSSSCRLPASKFFESKRADTNLLMLGDGDGGGDDGSRSGRDNLNGSVGVAPGRGEHGFDFVGVVGRYVDGVDASVTDLGL